MYRNTSLIVIVLVLVLAAAVAASACHEKQPGTGTRGPAAAAVAARVAPPEPQPPAPIEADRLPASVTPYLPPQCYARTQEPGERAHNSCFTCHVDTLPPNYTGDGDLQLGYAFGPPARVNPWTNLFVDRRAQVAALSDEDTRAYVRQDNYPALAARLVGDVAAWDSNGDGKWSGWTPDLAFHFDAQGFDRRADGVYTGWRAYAYFPLPGAFWPTNGGFGDAFVRLPAAFRERADGRFDAGLYATNLAILEAMIARRDVPIPVTDERAVNVDLDGDGRLGQARRVRYRWKPGIVDLTWVGRAGLLRAAGQLHFSAGLFPEGTELAHSLRYLDADGDKVKMGARMKELRYMVKTGWVTYGALEYQASAEGREKAQTPDRTRLLVGSTEAGIKNGAGWRLAGFIEDARGALRPQTLAETAYCIGCHSGVGATDDSVFSFGRKLPGDAFQRGWYHASQRGLEGLAEPRRADGQGEYAFYLAANRAGDDLRENHEVLDRFFDAAGALRADMVARLAKDVSLLLVPSAARALQLDKAYRVIVAEQSFVNGRDPTITPALHVHRELPASELSTGVEEPLTDRRRGPPALAAVAARQVKAHPGR